MLSLEADGNPFGLSMGDGQRARSTGTVREVSAGFNHRHLKMDFCVMESLPFDVIIGVPVFEALQGCLDFGLQRVTLVSGGKKATLPFEYAVIEDPFGSSLETDSEDIGSDPDANLDAA